MLKRSRSMKGGYAAQWVAKFRILEADALARNIALCDLSEMSGLARSTISRWVLRHVQPQRGSWQKVQATLATLPVVKPELLPVLPLQVMQAVDPALDETPVQNATPETSTPKMDHRSPEHMARMRAKAAEKLKKEKEKEKKQEAKTVVIPQQFIDKAQDEVATAKGALIRLINSKLMTYTLMDLALILSKMEEDA